MNPDYRTGLVILRFFPFIFRFGYLGRRFILHRLVVPTVARRNMFTNIDDVEKDLDR